jgi:hypothetical protein
MRNLFSFKSKINPLQEPRLDNLRTKLDCLVKDGASTLNLVKMENLLEEWESMTVAVNTLFDLRDTAASRDPAAFLTSKQNDWPTLVPFGLAALGAPVASTAPERGNSKVRKIGALDRMRLGKQNFKSCTFLGCNPLLLRRLRAVALARVDARATQKRSEAADERLLRKGDELRRTTFAEKVERRQGQVQQGTKQAANKRRHGRGDSEGADPDDVAEENGSDDSDDGEARIAAIGSTGAGAGVKRKCLRRVVADSSSDEELSSG